MFLTDRTRQTSVFVCLFHCQNGVIDGPLVSVPYPALPFLRRVAALSTSLSAALSLSLAASRRMSTPSLYRSLPHTPTSALSRLYGKLQVPNPSHMSPWLKMQKSGSFSFSFVRLFICRLQNSFSSILDTSHR